LSIKIAFTEIERFAGGPFAAPTLHQLWTIWARASRARTVSRCAPSL